MVYNPSKTEFIVFGKRLKLPKFFQLCVQGSLIDPKSSISVLGIRFESTLSWNAHVTNNIKSANSQLYALRYLNYHLTRPHFRQVINAQYINRLLYALPVWGRTINNNLANKLNTCLYKAMRLICKDFSFKLHRSELIRLTQVRNFPSFRIIHECTMLQSLIMHKNAGYLTDRLEAQSYRNSRFKGRMTFKGFALKRPGTVSFVHQAKRIAEMIPFPWLDINPKHFKKKIKLITPLQISTNDL